MSALVISFLVGSMTTLNPSVLPLLPIVFAASLLGGKLGSVAMVAGLVASFTIAGIVVAPDGKFLGIDHNKLEPYFDILFALIGIALIVPALERKFSAWFRRAEETVVKISAHSTLLVAMGLFATGVLFGGIWSPSSGPALDAAIELAADADNMTVAALRMAAFGLGAASILLLGVFGLRKLLLRGEPREKIAPRIKQFAGALFLAPAIGMLSGIDRVMETKLLNTTPNWLLNLVGRL
jgi:cytochrome c biogenesis protein CcdA